MENVSSFLSRLLLPRDFRDLLHEEGDFVFEVDRSTAQIHWEMLAPEVGDRWSRTPLGVTSTVARQLRTTYSPAPQDATVQRDRLRALVIGDPGDPDMEDNLPGARKEAFEVRKVLRDNDVEVTALIGAPNASRRGIPRDVAPASRIEVLNQLMHGRFDLLHYCGHGDFDPKDPSRVGWVFASGLLTAREIERIDRVPDLVVANACLSARLSETTEGRRRTKKTRSEAGLLPSLADEFFHLGVRNYVGTSWEVSDVGAILFAQTLYKELLTGKSGGILGDAVKKARAALYKKERSFGKLWAAYQHYGDPTAEIRRP